MSRRQYRKQNFSTKAMGHRQPGAGFGAAPPAPPDFGWVSQDYVASAVGVAVTDGVAVPQHWGSQVWNLANNSGAFVSRWTTTPNTFLMTAAPATFVNGYARSDNQEWAGKTVAIRIFMADNGSANNTAMQVPGFGLVQYRVPSQELSTFSAGLVPLAAGTWFTWVFRFNGGNTNLQILTTAISDNGAALAPGTSQPWTVGGNAGQACPALLVGGFLGWNNVTVLNAAITTAVTTYVGI